MGPGWVNVVRPEAPGGAVTGGGPSSCGTPSGPGGGGLLRERTQKKTGTAITAVTTLPIHQGTMMKLRVTRSSDPNTATAILREHTPARTSTATTPVTGRPIRQYPTVRKTSAARSSSPDTATAVLPDRCPARAA